MKAAVTSPPMISVPTSVIKEFMSNSSSDTGAKMEQSNSVASNLPASISISPAKGSSMSSVLTSLPSSISIQSKSDQNFSSSEDDENSSDENTATSISKLLPNATITPVASQKNVPSSFSSSISISGATADSTLATLASLGSSISTVSNGITISNKSSLSLTKKTSDDSDEMDTPTSSPPPKRRKSRSSSPIPATSSASGLPASLLSSISLTHIKKPSSPFTSESSNSSRESSESREDSNQTSLPKSISVQTSKPKLRRDAFSSNRSSRKSSISRPSSPNNDNSLNSDDEKIEKQLNNVKHKLESRNSSDNDNTKSESTTKSLSETLASLGASISFAPSKQQDGSNKQDSEGDSDDQSQPDDTETNDQSKQSNNDDKSSKSNKDNWSVRNNSDTGSMKRSIEQDKSGAGDLKKIRLFRHNITVKPSNQSKDYNKQFEDLVKQQLENEQKEAEDNDESNTTSSSILLNSSISLKPASSTKSVENSSDFQADDSKTSSACNDDDDDDDNFLPNIQHTSTTAVTTSSTSITTNNTSEVKTTELTSNNKSSSISITTKESAVCTTSLDKAPTPSLSTTLKLLDNQTPYDKITPLQPVAEFSEPTSNTDSNSCNSTLTELTPLSNLSVNHSSDTKTLQSITSLNTTNNNLHQLPSTFESRKAEIYHLEKRLKSLRGAESNSASKENSRKYLDDEIRQVHKDTKRKLKRFGRKELEALILEQITENVLHQHELGKQKQLRERLEATIESIRMKNAQFHKDFEDMKKVTQKLQNECNQRKNLIPAPIKIKRSVGIQAAPSIINKGIMNTLCSSSDSSTQHSTTTAVAVAPSTQVRRVENTSTSTSNPKPLPLKLPSYSEALNNNVTNDKQFIPVTVAGGQVVQATGTTSNIRPVSGGQQMLLVTGQSTSVPVVLPRVSQDSSGTQAGSTGSPILSGQLLRRIAPGQPNVFQATPGTVFAQRPVLVTQALPTTVRSNVASQPVQKVAPKPQAQVNNSGIIDLTDDDDNSRTVSRVSSSKSTQAIHPNTPVLLVPASRLQPRSTLFLDMATTQVNPQSSKSNSNSSSNTSTPSSSRESTPQQLRHPAPLPRTPVQQMGGSTKQLPPQPTLRLNHKENSIVLSWTMSKTDDHEGIASYQLYAYQEGSSPPSPKLWKKVGSVKALELPMACTLTQFMPGHMYHFAVRAVDAKNRLGSFSEPKSIRLNK